MRSKDSFEISLWKAIRVGDGNAFAELYLIYFDLVFKRVYSLLKNYHDSEEVVQNIFILLWEKRTTLQFENLRNYLLGIATKQSLLFIRNKKSTPEYLDLFDTIFAETCSESIAHQPDFAFEKSERIFQLVQKEIHDLPAQMKKIVELYFLSNKSVHEISNLLQLSPNTVRTQITRARHRLKPKAELLYSIYLIVAIANF